MRSIFISCCLALACLSLVQVCYAQNKGETLYHFPLFAWTNPHEEMNKRMEKDLTLTLFKKNWLIAPMVARESGRFRLGKNTKAAILYQEHFHTTLKHTPGKGYSEWTLPDFRQETQGSEYWHIITVDFTLKDSIKNYAIPLSFRTSLSPRNKIELNYYRDGSFEVMTATPQGKKSYRTKKKKSAIGRSRIEYRLSHEGKWKIFFNDKLVDTGAFDRKFIEQGLSNKYWFEGTIHLHALTIDEAYPLWQAPLVWGLREKQLDEYNIAAAHEIRKHFRKYGTSVSAQFSEDKAEMIDLAQTYLSRKTLANDASGDFRYVYFVSLLVTFENEKKKTITLPMQYEMTLNETKGEIETLAFMFNQEEKKYFHDFEDD